jgi:hypothetical protein
MLGKACVELEPVRHDLEPVAALTDHRELMTGALLLSVFS